MGRYITLAAETEWLKNIETIVASVGKDLTTAEKANAEAYADSVIDMKLHEYDRSGWVTATPPLVRTIGGLLAAAYIHEILNIRARFNRLEIDVSDRFDRKAQLLIKSIKEQGVVANADGSVSYPAAGTGRPGPKTCAATTDAIEHDIFLQVLMEEVHGRTLV
jgi:hypothetical protein